MYVDYVGTSICFSVLFIVSFSGEIRLNLLKLLHTSVPSDDVVVLNPMSVSGAKSHLKTRKGAVEMQVF